MNIRDQDLERYVLGELPPDRHSAIHDAAESDADLAARIAAISASDAAILAEHPPERVVPEIERRIHLAATRDAVAGGSTTRWWSAAALVVAAAVALFAVGPILLDDAEYVGVKGGQDPELRIHLQVDGGDRQLGRGDVARAGDLIQVGYLPAGATHGVIVSLDGRGEVTLHHPASPRGSTALGRGGEILVPRAWELDDAPDFERFFLVTATVPVDVHEVIDAAEAVGDSTAPRSTELGVELPWTDFVLRKADP